MVEDLMMGDVLMMVKIYEDVGLVILIWFLLLKYNEEGLFFWKKEI